MTTLKQFLIAHKIPKGNPNKLEVTHTRIGDKSLNIYGGSYNIPDDKLDEFYNLYHQHVVVKGNKEYLTEAQRNDDDAVLYIDFDFRYPLTQTERIEDFNDILQDLVSYVAITSNELMDTKEPFSLLIMIKPAVNVCESKGYTKDGIHLVGNFTMPRHIQLELRNRLMKDKDFKQIITDIGATNSMDSVYDDGIVKGSINTQLYGSRKPAHDAYEIIARLDCVDCEYNEYEYKMVGSIDIDTFKTACVKYLNNKNVVEYIDIPKPEPRAKRTLTARSGCPQTDETVIFDPCSIFNNEDLDNALSSIMTPQMEKLCEFTCALSSTYSDDYGKWYSMGCALKCESANNFLVWMRFSTKSDKFNYDSIESFYETWEKFYTMEEANEKCKNGGLTFASICDWLKTDNPEKFNELCLKYKVEKVFTEPAMNIEKLIFMKSDLHQTEIDTLGKNVEDYNKDKQKEINDQILTLKAEQKAETMKMKCEYFDAYHFKIMSPPCFGRTAYDKTMLLTSHDINLMYENVLVGKTKFTDDWRRRMKINSYESVDFLPYPRENPKHIFNTFRGLRASKLPALKSSDTDIDIKIILDHMRILSGKEEKSYDYLLKYMAHLVQRPGEVPKISLVFQSDEGVGKNVFFENFGYKILGKENVLQTAEMDKVIGRFSMINNKLLVIMDETDGKDSFSNSNKIKNIITSDYIAWERKGIDGININNCGRYLIFSNNKTPVKIGMTDRRFVVYSCSNDRQNDIVYFKSMIKMFNCDKHMRKFYDYLMSIDISEWDMVNTRPITKAYKDIQSVNIPIVARFLEYMVDEYSELWTNIIDTDSNLIKIASSSLFELFSTFCSDSKYKFDYTSTKFGREMKEYQGVDQKRFSGGKRGYLIDKIKLMEYMTSKGYIEEVENIEMELNDT